MAIDFQFSVDDNVRFGREDILSPGLGGKTRQMYWECLFSPVVA